MHHRLATILCLELALVHSTHAQGLSSFREFDGQTSVVAIDGSTAYLAGSQHLLISGASQAFLRKIDAEGNTLWSRQFGQLTSVLSLVVFNRNVYFAGTTQGALPGQRNAGPFNDAFAGEYDAEGNLLWIRQFGTDGYDSAVSITADESGVYVVSQEAPLADRYHPRSILRKYDFAGTQVWSRALGESILFSNAAVGAGGIYLGGYAYTPVDAGAIPTGAVLRKLDFGGVEQWTQRIEPALMVTGIATHATGLYAVGESYDRVSVWKFDVAGNQVWERQTPKSQSPFNSWSTNPKLAVDDTGIYVNGETPGTLPGQCTAGALDVVVRKYDLTGQPLWTRQFGTRRTDFAGTIAVDSTGVYMAGMTRYDVLTLSTFLAKLEKTPAPVTAGKPRILWECVLNAASLQGGGIAPGEIVTIRGSGIGPTTPSSASFTQGRLTTTAAETRVLFDGVAAPLIYVSDEETSAIVPYGVAGRPFVDVVVEYRGIRSDAVATRVLESRPGIFTASAERYDEVAALNQDGTINSASNPAERGSIITFFATGEGLTDPAGDDGAIAGTLPPQPKLPVEVWFEFWNYLIDAGYFPARVLYAGGSPRSPAGLLQVNARIPEELPGSGLWRINLRIGSEQVGNVVLSVR